MAPGRHRLTAAALLVLAVLAVTLAGCVRLTSNTATGPSGAGNLTPFYTQRLAWSGCAGIFECATLTVPLDYADPAKGTIQLAVIRARASDPAHRIGALITNPGGPGGSGVEFVKESYPSQTGRPSHFDPQLRADFDIVGFDPRGVGQSAPITCLTDAQLDQFYALDPAPATPSEVAALVTGDKAFAAGCQAHSAALLPYVGTPNAARDMDILRAALGEEKLYYLGTSYGTYLGAIYAELFPTHIARAVLDGPLPPDLTTKQLGIGQARAFQAELSRFLDDCVTHPDCPLGPDPATAAGRLADFLASTKERPLPTGTDRMVAEALADTGVLVTMYDSPRSWPTLRKILAIAMTGDGRGLLTLADLYYQRDPKTGHYSNQSEAYVAINCVDHPDPVRFVQAELPDYEQASPLLGASFAWGDLMCSYWPVPPESQPHPVHYAGTPPILVVGTTNDPATPYPFAQDMAQQLGSALLLTYDYDGHTAYGRGSTCVNNAVDAYLTQASLPPPATVCHPDPQPSR